MQKFRKKNKFSKRHNSAEQKALAKINLKVGWMRAIFFEVRGRIDGKLDLPRLDEKNLWVSPFIEKEKHIVETFKAQKWGEHEIIVSEKQEKVIQLKTEIENIETLLLHKKSQTPKIIEKDLKLVLKQERETDPEVVQSRRQNEWNKKNSNFFAEMKELECKMNDLKQYQAKLLADIYESVCIVRLVCEKKHNLCRQIIDIYFQGVLKTHPKRKDMYPISKIVWENYAENLYKNQHWMDEEGYKHVVI